MAAVHRRNTKRAAMKIAIASDHAGFEYKQKLIDFLSAAGHEVQDFGTNSAESCDYPDFVHPASQAVADGICERGIVLGGSGNGEAMAANHHAGIRCALVWSDETASLSRLHNNANMIAIGQRQVGFELAKAMVRIWLETDFEGGRHERRIAGIDAPSPG